MTHIVLSQVSPASLAHLRARRLASWRELYALVEQVVTGGLDPFRHMTRAEFWAMLARIDERSSTADPALIRRVREVVLIWLEEEA